MTVYTGISCHAAPIMIGFPCLSCFLYRAHSAIALLARYLNGYFTSMSGCTSPITAEKSSLPWPLRISRLPTLMHPGKGGYLSCKEKLQLDTFHQPKLGGFEAARVAKRYSDCCWTFSCSKIMLQNSEGMCCSCSGHETNSYGQRITRLTVALSSNVMTIIIKGVNSTQYTPLCRLICFWHFSLGQPFIILISSPAPMRLGLGLPAGMMNRRLSMLVPSRQQIPLLPCKIQSVFMPKRSMLCRLVFTKGMMVFFMCVFMC